MADRDALLSFPCDFPIKAVGRAGAGLDGAVVAIVRRHAPDLREGAVTSRASRGGKYESVTVVIQATSRAQLDAIYLELNACDLVMMVL